MVDLFVRRATEIHDKDASPTYVGELIRPASSSGPWVAHVRGHGDFSAPTRGQLLSEIETALIPRTSQFLHLIEPINGHDKKDRNSKAGMRHGETELGRGHLTKSKKQKKQKRSEASWERMKEESRASRMSKTANVETNSAPEKE